MELQVKSEKGTQKFKKIDTLRSNSSWMTATCHKRRFWGGGGLGPPQTLDHRQYFFSKQNQQLALAIVNNH